MDREGIAASLQLVLVLLGVALQAVGVFVFPFHLAPFSFSEVVYGYESLLVLLPFVVASFLLIVLIALKVVQLGRKIRFSGAGILAFATALSIGPAWTAFLASLVPLETAFMWVYNPYMALLSGFYLYLVGCILIVVSQVVVSVVVAGHLPALGVVSRWMERNRGSVVGVLLMMTMFSFGVYFQGGFL